MPRRLWGLDLVADEWGGVASERGESWLTTRSATRENLSSIL